MVNPLPDWSRRVSLFAAPHADSLFVSIFGLELHPDYSMGLDQRGNDP